MGMFDSKIANPLGISDKILNPAGISDQILDPLGIFSGPAKDPMAGYAPDFKAREEREAAIRERYGSVGEDVTEAGKLRQAEMDKAELADAEAIRGSAKSNLATTESMLNMFGGDQLSSNIAGRQGAIGELAALGGSSDMYSQMSDLAKSQDFATQDVRAHDVSTNILPRMGIETAGMKNRVGMAVSQSAALTDKRATDKFSNIVGTAGGIVGAIYGGPAGATAGSSLGSAAGSAVYS